MQQAVPPPSRPPGMGKLRMRRQSAPFQTSQRDLLTASDSSEHGAPGSLVPRTPTSPSTTTNHTVEKRLQVQEPLPLAAEKESRRESSMIFAVQPSKHAQNDTMTMVASLQQNIVGLTSVNQREKAANEYLKNQVQSLSAELAKVNELYEEEKTKNEKIAAMRRQQRSGTSDYTGYLPDIHSTAAQAAAAVALQQQAQLELTYQRKILSLENRYKDLAENNKRLLRKIEQLEKTEQDADSMIENLRQENERLGTQVDTLSSTVASQTSLIIGLRTSLQKLNQDEHQMGTLLKKLDRSQIDLEATRVREKMLRDEHERMKLIVSKEKESLMAKIMDFQQRLQQSDRAGDNLEALHEQVKRLDGEKRLVIEEMLSLREQVAKAETRMHEQEQMTNRLLLETEALQMDKKDLASKLSRLQEELAAKSVLESKVAVLHEREREIEQLMTRTIELQGEIDAAAHINTKLQSELSSLKQMQLSHDETVQALQLARQKAATHEALALVNEEKQALETKIQELQAEWAADRATLTLQLQVLEEERNRRQQQVDELTSEVTSLRNRPVEQIIVETVARPSTAEVNERARVEADIERLRSEYEELRESFDSMENEYNRLITKKYKTEAFQSQVKLLHNENNELGSRLDDLVREQERDRAELHARAMEIAELQSRVLDPQAIAMLRQTQESLEKTVSSLVEAEIASESTFTCLQCMRLYVSPMTLTPCGHTYCSSCMDSMGDVSDPSSLHCKECAATQRQESESVFPNQALADLTARYIFRQQTLSSLTTMCLSLRNSFATRSSV